MDLTFLDKGSSVTPLIVQLYDNHKLYALARDKTPEARKELTSAIAEVLEKNVGASENELIADIMIALTRQAEADLRQAIAERIAVMENVPLRLVLQLANDEIEIAAPVLRSSPVLGDLDLVYIIKSKGADYWKEIAARQQLSGYMINLLAETRDMGTALALAENSVITLTENALSILTDLAETSETLAGPLVRRNEMTATLAARLYHAVGEELKTFIAAHYKVDPADLKKVVDEVVEEFAAPKTAYTPTDSMLEAARKYKERGQLTVELMTGSLRRGQFQNFIAQFAVYSGFSVKAIEGAFTQARGHGVVLACKAADMAKADFTTFFLLSNAMRSTIRIVDLKDMGRAIEYFDRLKTSTARDLLNQE